MTDRTPAEKPQTLGQLVTQAIQTVQAKISPEVELKPNTRVPELQVKMAEGDKPSVYRLVGNEYLVGRSSKSCDITIRNPLVSQVHLSLKRDRQRKGKFILKDEGSTNGVYKGKRQIKSLVLRHGDTLTLGPPELANAVQIQYYDPPPAMVQGLRYALYGTGSLVGVLAVVVGIEWTRFSVRPLPTGIQGPVVVYSRDGQTSLNPFQGRVHRELDRLSDFSPYLPDAVIASEDSRYYWHLGVDPIGILRAIAVNLEGQTIRQGGSTVTQQLARSLYPNYVGRDNTLGRKLREMVVALKLETFYSKDEILRLYLNRVYLGVGSYGFDDAARFYFDKSAADLTLSEAAALVAILPAPNLYNPVRDYQTAVELRNRVIDRMAQLGMISPQEAQRARRSRIEVSPRARATLSNIKAPYFYSHVLQELRSLLGEELAAEGNLIVETALDLQAQENAESTLRRFVETQGSTNRFQQGALVMLDTRTGEILALVGGVDYQQSQFNRATQAQRQPGSTFKVFAYAAALERGIPPYKTYSCAPLNWKGMRYRGCERSGGKIDLYRGMALSENAVALRVAQDVGLSSVVRMAQRLGIESTLNPVPGLVLGQSEVNLLEMTGAYAVFANNGVWNRPHAIARILDASDCTDEQDLSTCREIYAFERSAQANQQVISGAIAQTTTSLLRGVVRGGTGSSAAIGWDAAGKTGTTDNAVDLWFIGYVPARDRVTGVWLGNDDNSPTRGSSANAARLWGDYMRQVLP